MKRLIPIATTVASLLVLAASLTSQPVHAGTGIILVDVPKVFENHQRFHNRMLEVRQDVEQFGVYLQGERQKLSVQQQELVKIPAGSPERKGREGQMTQSAANLEVKRQLEVKNVREKEARIYLEAYNEVVREVQEIARRQGATLVLHFSNDQIDPNRRDSVIVGVNRPVVFQNGLDVTQEVINRLNRNLPPKDLNTGAFVPPPGPRR